MRSRIDGRWIQKQGINIYAQDRRGEAGIACCAATKAIFNPQRARLLPLSVFHLQLIKDDAARYFFARRAQMSNRRTIHIKNAIRVEIDRHSDAIGPESLVEGLQQMRRDAMT